MAEFVAVLDAPEQTLSLQKVAVGLFKSGLFPNAKNEYGAFAIIEYGRELGVPSMMALKNINIISGQVACNAQLMLSLALRNGVTYEVKEESDTGAKIVFKRGDMPPYTAEFTKKDAEAAGLTGKDNWKKYPKDMYFWRCVAKGVRRVAPDAVMGLYTPDEITEGKYVEVTDFPVEVVEETEKQPEKERVPMASEAQVKAIHAIISAKSPDSDHLLWVNDALGLIGKEEELEHVSMETITRDMAQNLFNKFETLKWSKPRGK
jgi:hypothetical protein